VLITAEGPKVVDFGIAHLGDATAITQSGGFLGSSGYLAPEQAA
jgi:serine/threonine protein kinase